jgi:hypothetical protein
MPAFREEECEKNHISAVPATFFQNATSKICFRIQSVAIFNHPSRRTKAERDLIQDGFATNLLRRNRTDWKCYVAVPPCLTDARDLPQGLSFNTRRQEPERRTKECRKLVGKATQRSFEGKQ